MRNTVIIQKVSTLYCVEHGPGCINNGKAPGVGICLGDKRVKKSYLPGSAGASRSDDYETRGHFTPGDGQVKNITDKGEGTD